MGAGGGQSDGMHHQAKPRPPPIPVSILHTLQSRQPLTRPPKHPDKTEKTEILQIRDLKRPSSFGLGTKPTQREKEKEKEKETERKFSKFLISRDPLWVRANTQRERERESERGLGPQPGTSAEPGGAWRWPAHRGATGGGTARPRPTRCALHSLLLAPHLTPRPPRRGRALEGGAPLPSSRGAQLESSAELQAGGGGAWGWGFTTVTTVEPPPAPLPRGPVVGQARVVLRPDGRERNAGTPPHAAAYPPWAWAFTWA